MTQDAISKAASLNQRILDMMDEVNDLGIALAYDGTLDGAPEWIDELLTVLETASDILEEELPLE